MGDDVKRPLGRRFLAGLVLVVVGLSTWIYLKTSASEIVIEFGPAPRRVAELRQVILIPVVASASSRDKVVVTFELAGTASEGQDFAFPRRQVTIPAGSTQVEVPLRVLMDRERGEQDEVVEVSIARVVGGTIGFNQVFILTIEGDLPTPVSPPLSSAPSFPTPGTSSPDSVSTPGPATTGESTTGGPTTGGPTTPTSTSPPSQPGQSSIEVRAVTDGAEQDVASIGLDGSADTGSVLLVLIANTTTEGTAPIPGLGGSQSWDMVATSTRNEGPRRLTMFRTVATKGTFELSIGFAQRQGVVDWIVLELQGVPTRGNGASAIVQSGVNAAVDFEFVGFVQLGPVSGSDHVTIGGFFAGTDGLAPGPGFELEAVVGPLKRRLLAMSGSDPFVTTAQWDERAHWLGIAVEVANAG
jgi:Calx-beta domain